MTETLYILSGRDKSIVSAAKQLLWKIVRSPFPTAEQGEQLGRLLVVLDRMPVISDELSVVVPYSMVG